MENFDAKITILCELIRFRFTDIVKYLYMFGGATYTKVLLSIGTARRILNLNLNFEWGPSTSPHTIRSPCGFAPLPLE